jgi:hypothetical protein
LTWADSKLRTEAPPPLLPLPPPLPEPPLPFEPLPEPPATAMALVDTRVSL